MKRGIGILLCILILSGFLTVNVMAEEGSGEGEGQTTEEALDAPMESEGTEGEVSAAIFHIETENRYEGMDRPYKEGYMPTVADGKVSIVLPLAAEQGLMGNELTASVNLGATELTPFVYKNYEKVFSFDAERNIYCVSFSLELSKDRYNGNYPVVITVKAKTESGTEIMQSFPVYVSITDGKDLNESLEEAAKEEKPTSNPMILLDSYRFDKETVYAGEVFQVTVAIKNTSTTKSVQNMVITLEYDAQKFFYLGESESIYVSKLEKGKTMEIPLSFQVNRNTAEGNDQMTIRMSYDDPEAATFQSSGVITIPVRQNPDVRLTVPQISESVRAGDTLPLDFQVLNLGRSTVYNVRCDIAGEGLVATATAFVGNLEGGTEGTASMNLFISTKDKTGGSTSTEKYGKTEGVITLTYEDVDGQEYTQEFPFTTSIEEPAKPVAATVKEQKTAGQWWISVMVLAVILAAGGGVTLVRGRRKHEKETDL